MKQLQLATLAGVALASALALGSGSAKAADLTQPVYKAPPPPPAPTYSWTGCYLDAGGGYGMWRQNHHDETDPGFIAETEDISTGGSGWYGTIGGGCDYQVGAIAGGNVIIGAFADYDFMSLTGTYTVPLNGLYGTEKESGAWAVGARLGYAFTPTLMGYVNGGWTQAHFNAFGLDFPGTVIASPFSVAAQTFNGWFTGGGSEMSLAPWLPQGFFLRSEYRYSSYSGQDVAYLPLVDTGTASHETKQVQTITTALVWKFNWAAPVAARY